MSCPQSGQRTMLIASEPEQALQPAPVEADDDVVIDDDHRHGHPTCPCDEFCASRFVFRNVFRHERDSLLRKKLFRGVAGRSGRGPVHRHCSIHGSDDRRSGQRPPNVSAANLNASAKMTPAPGVSGWLVCHALRCSSDRKKLRSVQSPDATRVAHASRGAIHTMTSGSERGASGPASITSGSAQ